MTTTKPFQLGSISTGTLRPEDLLPAFADALEEATGMPGTHAGEYYADDVIIEHDAHGNVTVLSMDRQVLWSTV